MMDSSTSFDNLNRLYEFKNPGERYDSISINNIHKSLHRLSLSAASFPLSRSCHLTSHQSPLFIPLNDNQAEHYEDLGKQIFAPGFQNDVMNDNDIYSNSIGDNLPQISNTKVVPPNIFLSSSGLNNEAELLRRRAFTRRTHSSVDQQYFNKGFRDKMPSTRGKVLPLGARQGLYRNVLQQVSASKKVILKLKNNPDMIPEEDGCHCQEKPKFQISSNSIEIPIGHTKNTSTTTPINFINSVDVLHDLSPAINFSPNEGGFKKTNDDNNYPIDYVYSSTTRNMYERNDSVDSKSVESEPDTLHADSHEFISNSLRKQQRIVKPWYEKICAEELPIEEKTQNQSQESYESSSLEEVVEEDEEDLATSRPGSFKHQQPGKRLLRAQTVMDMSEKGSNSVGSSISMSNTRNKTPYFYIKYDPITAKNKVYSSNASISLDNNNAIATDYITKNSKMKLVNNNNLDENNIGVNLFTKLAGRRMSYVLNNNINNRQIEPTNITTHRGSLNSLQNWPLHSSPSLEKLYLIT